MAESKISRYVERRNNTIYFEEYSREIARDGQKVEILKGENKLTLEQAKSEIQRLTDRISELAELKQKLIDAVGGEEDGGQDPDATD